MLFNNDRTDKRIDDSNKIKVNFLDLIIPRYQKYLKVPIEPNQKSAFLNS